MHPLRLSFTPIATDADGLANDVAYAAGGYALTGGMPRDDLAHIVTVAGNAATNHSDKTFTVTGLDSDGNAQTDSFVGPNGVATVSSAKFFSSVTSVTVSATTGADTFDIGWTGESVSRTVPLNWRQQEFNMSLAVEITGTINYEVQHCFQRMSDGFPQSFTWFDHASLTNKAANADGNYASPVTGTRLHINSVTAGATISFMIVQST